MPSGGILPLIWCYLDLWSREPLAFSKFVQGIVATHTLIYMTVCCRSSLLLQFLHDDELADTIIEKSNAARLVVQEKIFKV